MSTMGIVYNASSAPSNEQLMLQLRTLQDNDRNINTGLAANGQLVKNNVSVINLNTSVTAHNQQIKQQQQQQQQTNNQVLPPYDPSRLKKHGKNGQPPPIAVAKRNARERNRVKQVNNGFATLRQHIPSHVAQGYGDRGKKLSKVETLRMAVEYIRGLQRLLAEADGLDYEASLRSANNDSSMMIPSPTGSVYSSSTHNGSGDVLGLDEHQQDVDLMNDDDDDMEDEVKDRRDAKRFRDEPRAQSRLSENQNRERCRRREDNYYKQASFGDEENIEPLVNRNNNNNSNTNNNNVLASFSPILMQSATASNHNVILPSIKREVHLLEEDESRRSSEDDSANGAGVILASSSPYSGEIFIENPETGRLVPLKIEEHEAQLVYVSAEPAYYKSALQADSGAQELSWWEQECIVQQMHQSSHHQPQQQPATAQPSQRPLAHV